MCASVIQQIEPWNSNKRDRLQSFIRPQQVDSDLSSLGTYCQTSGSLWPTEIHSYTTCQHASVAKIDCVALQGSLLPLLFYLSQSMIFRRHQLVQFFKFCKSNITISLDQFQFQNVSNRSRPKFVRLSRLGVALKVSSDKCPEKVLTQNLTSQRWAIQETRTFRKDRTSNEQ